MIKDYSKNLKEIFIVTGLLFVSFFIFISTSSASSSVPDKWGRCANNTDGSLHVCDPDLVSALNYDFPVSFETKDTSRQYSYLVNVPMSISSGTELISYDFTIRLENNTSTNFYLFGVHSTNITTSWKTIQNCGSLISMSVWGSTPSNSSCSLSIRKADSSNAIYDVRVSGTVQYKNALNASSGGFRVRLGTYATSGTTIANSMLTTSSLGTNRLVFDFTSFNYSTSNKADLTPIVDEQQKTNEKLDEAENTRKGIWGTIKEIFTSIIELPGKIVNLLIDGLKSLFIPSDDFFENFINDFKDKFLNKLGFLAYPFELIGDILSRYMNIASNPVITIPNIYEPFTGGLLISATSVNLKEIFEYGAIGTMYGIYRSCVSVLIIVMFLNFAIKKYDEFVKNKGSGD